MRRNAALCGASQRQELEMQNEPKLKPGRLAVIAALPPPLGERACTH
jgi:hypothetical protein